MNRYEKAAKARMTELKIKDEKATDLDVILSEVMKLPYGQLKKVLTEPVMEVLAKYGDIK